MLKGTFFSGNTFTRSISAHKHCLVFSVNKVEKYKVLLIYHYVPDLLQGSKLHSDQAFQNPYRSIQQFYYENGIFQHLLTGLFFPFPPYTINCSLEQGGALSPLLLNIALESIVQKETRLFSLFSLCPCIIWLSLKVQIQQEIQLSILSESSLNWNMLQKKLDYESTKIKQNICLPQGQNDET